MGAPSEYLDRLRTFARSLQGDSDLLDTDINTMGRRYRQFVAESLHMGWTAHQPLSGRDFCEALAILAEHSGAFAFITLQQFVANANLSVRAPALDPWPCVGVAFGHLRNPRGPAPQWDGQRANGLVPWMTGAGLFQQVILGMRGNDGQEVYALVDATNRAAFRHGAPMDLIACTASCTLSVQIVDLRVDENTVLKTEAAGTFQQNDTNGVLYQTPLMVGCVRACRDLIRLSPRVGVSERDRSESATERILHRVYTAFAGCTAEEGQQLRAELGDFAVRLARLSVMASGGVGLVRSHPAQRLYREALLYTVMAQTDPIINQAIREVFV